jgi:predicted nucleotidyltransferase
MINDKLRRKQRLFHRSLLITSSPLPSLRFFRVICQASLNSCSFDISSNFLYIYNMSDITKDEIQKRLKSNKSFIESEFHVIDLGLFGSFAAGENTADSDIDILVNLRRGHKDFFNYMRLKNYLQELLGREVDLVMRGAVKPRLRERILNRVQYV